MKRLVLALPLLLTGCMAIPGLSVLTGAATGQGLGPGAGGAVSLTVSDATGANVDTTAFGSGAIVAGGVSGPITNISAASTNVGLGGAKARTMTIMFAGKPTAGASYTVKAGTSPTTSGIAAVTYVEGGSSGQGAAWNGSGGTISVESVSGATVTFALKAVTMAKTGSDDTNKATGGFTFNGSFKVDKLSGL